jgi:hypothetical protein
LYSNLRRGYLDMIMNLNIDWNEWNPDIYFIFKNWINLCIVLQSRVLCIGMVNRKLSIVFTCLHSQSLQKDENISTFAKLKDTRWLMEKFCCNRVIHKVILSWPCLWACFHSPIPSFSGICKVRNLY